MKRNYLIQATKGEAKIKFQCKGTKLCTYLDALRVTGHKVETINPIGV